MSEDDMFPGTFSESPRLAWMRRHRLDCWETKGEELPWTCACIAGGFPDFTWAVYGKTAEEACADYAHKNGIKHWSQE